MTAEEMFLTMIVTTGIGLMWLASALPGPSEGMTESDLRAQARDREIDRLERELFPEWFSSKPDPEDRVLARVLLTERRIAAFEEFRGECSCQIARQKGGV